MPLNVRQGKTSVSGNAVEADRPRHPVRPHHLPPLPLIHPHRRLPHLARPPAAEVAVPVAEASPRASFLKDFSLTLYTMSDWVLVSSLLEPFTPLKITLNK